ncbi:hypothetical protein Tco_0103623 [Tanacetum coccineum]
MEDEEVAMVDGVFEGAFGALGDKTWQWVRIFPMDPIDDIINAIVKMRIMFHDVSKKTSQEHAIRKIGIWSSPSIFNSFDKEIKNGVIRTKKYAELSLAKKIQADCDMKAINIILQGLPIDIYSLFNHKRVSKDLWEKGSTTNASTYKFLNSLPPEWSNFVTDVKLVKDLHTTNFDKLHAYLQQHELHANEVRLMRERNQDPLAFVVNHQMTPPHFNTYKSAYYNPQETKFYIPAWSTSGTKGSNTSVSKAKEEKGCYVEGSSYTGAVITQNVDYQADDLDAYDFDCDDFSTAKEVLMANLSSYGSDILSKEKELLTKTFNGFKNESKEMEAKNIDKEIALEKKVKELDNIKAQQIRPMLYDGSVIAKETNVISIADFEETLMLEEESQSKMLLKQNFGKRFVLQQELSNEQAFRLQTSHPNTDQSASSPVKIEAPRELPKVNLVKTSLKKLIYHLGQFDNMVKKRITPDALTEGEWGFEHTKAVFLKEIIPFVKTLKDIFNVFDKDPLNETHFLIENDRLLNQIISQDIMNIVVNSSLDINTSVKVNSSVAMIDSVNYVEICNKCLELEDELIKQHNMVEKDEYNKLSKDFLNLNNTAFLLKLQCNSIKKFFKRVTYL